MRGLVRMPGGNGNESRWKCLSGIAVTSQQAAAVILVAIVLFPLVNYSVSGQRGLADPNIPVHVTPQRNLERFWNVQGAKFGETLEETGGYLQIQNISNVVFDEAIFYGEYFDASGKSCFSLVFSQADSIGEKGPIAPGEIRTLYATGYDLAPASKPSELKLYLIQQSSHTEAKFNSEGEIPMRAPVTFSLVLPGDEDKLQLEPEASSGGSSILDIILAEVTVDQDGVSADINVVDAASVKAIAWFREFVRNNMIFYPATDGGVPKTGPTLVLVQGIVHPEDHGILSILPRDSAWVKSYMRGLTGTEVPVVNEIIVGRPPTKVKRLGSMETVELPPAPPGLLQVESSGSDWSRSAFHWVADPSMPHHKRRELNVTPADNLIIPRPRK